MRILLTSGGTKVNIDSVRHIGNMSSGTFGAKIGKCIAEICDYKLDNLTFLRADGSKSPFKTEVDMSRLSPDDLYDDLQHLYDLHAHIKSRYTEVIYKDFYEYKNYIDLNAKNFDVIVLAAAVSDYTVKNFVDGKIRSSNALNIELTPAPKIISTIKDLNPNAKLVGFKLLVGSTQEELITAARSSIFKNDCDFVVANDLNDMKADNHKLTIVYRKDGKIETVEKSKNDPNYQARIVAQKILELGNK